MRSVVAPVNTTSSRESTSNLQEGLQYLLDHGGVHIGDADRAAYAELLAREGRDGRFSDGTSRLVGVFQEQRGLPITGEVNDQTAEALNAVLRKLGAFDDAAADWVVRGQVVGTDGPVNDVTVAVYDRDLFFRRHDAASGQLLGTTITSLNPESGANGWFSVAYRTSDFAPGDMSSGGAPVPDLVIDLSRDGQPVTSMVISRLPDGEVLTEEMQLSEDDLLLGIQPRPVELVRISIEGGPRELTEYELAWRAIEPLLPAPADGDPARRESLVCEAAARFDEGQYRDVSFAARETGLDLDVVTSLAGAARLWTAFGQDVPAAVFYGLIRAAGLIELRRLAAASLAELDAAARRAIAGHLIPALDDAVLTPAVETIHQVTAGLVLDDPVGDGRPALGKVLSLALDDSGKQAELLRLAAEHDGSAESFWESLRNHADFADHVDSIRYVVGLGALTAGNLQLIGALRDEVPAAVSLPALAAHLDRATAQRLVSDPAVTVPDHIPGADDAERRRIFADVTVGLLRNAHPTAAVARLAAELAAEGGQGPVTEPTARFLRRAALERDGFELATSRLADVSDLLDGTAEENAAVLDQALRIQRLFRISTSEENLTGLLRSGFGSAYEITLKLTSQGFIRNFQDQLGGAEQTALAYRRALALTAANVLIGIHGHQLARDATPDAVSSGLKDPPSWATLFGSAGGCACEHCQSWLSPAAYFVDLLLFLDKKHLAGQTETPLSVLLSRRPDLANLQLSCENTETTLPYVDLVNEVLETYVATGGVLDASAAHDVMNETPAQLLAQPQHVRAAAYTTLATAQYPPALPFDRSLELARGYLGLLGVPRQDLIAAFAGTFAAPGDDEAAVQAAEEAKRRERLADSLGISGRGYQTLTGEDFAGVPAPIETHDLYGLTAAELPGAVAAVPELLARLQVSLPDLIAVLRCRFVNPLQELAERFESILARFTVSSAELRAFMDAGHVADPVLTGQLARSGASPEQLGQALDALGAGFPPEQVAKLIVIHSAGGDDCDPAGMTVEHVHGDPLTDGELRAMSLFVRLWRRLGWTMQELDLTLRALGAQGTIPAGVLGALAGMEQLRRATGAGVPTLLSVWTPGAADHDQTLARILGLTGDDLELLRGLAGADPLAEASGVIAFGELVDQVRRSGFTTAQLRYLYGEEIPGPAALAAPDRSLVELASRLRAGLQAIAAEQEPPQTADDVTADAAMAKLGLLLAPGPVRRADATTVADDRTALALALIEGRPTAVTPSGADLDDLRAALVAMFPVSGPLAAALAAAAFPDPLIPLPPGAGEDERDQRELLRRDRLLAAVTAACALLRDVGGRALVIQTLADNLGMTADLVTALLEDGELLPAEPDGPSSMQRFAGLADPAADAGTPPAWLRHEYTRLHQIALLTGTLRLGRDELRYLVQHPDDFDGFALAPFGTAPYPQGFRAWRRLARYAELRDRLTPRAPRLADVFAAPVGQRALTLAAATGWTAAQIDDALAATGHTAESLTDERALDTLDRVLTLSRAAGTTATVLRSWTTQPPEQAQVEAIEAALRSRYGETGWLAVARQVNDPVRERARDALVAYVLAMPLIRDAGLRTPEQLFEHFLIDVQMSSRMLTSRIKQATCSVQLFVQRCLLNLESDRVTPDAIDAAQWQWRSIYRVWEANRKVFLFPENWIEPELRDDKSPFFRDLEAELLETDVTPDTVEQALHTYLEKLNTVANLDVVGFHWERAAGGDVLHVFGRTRTGIPRSHYYRRLVGREWTAWEPVGIDIPGVERGDDNLESGVHLLPVVWRGKLHLFWPEFMKKTEKQDGPVTLKADGTTLTPPPEFWEAKLAWSRYEHGRWSPKQLSSDFARWPRQRVVSSLGRLSQGNGGFAVTAKGPGGPVTASAGDPAELRLESRLEGGRVQIDMIMRADWNRRAETLNFVGVLADPNAAPVFVLKGAGRPRRLVAGAGRFQREKAIGPFLLGSPVKDVPSPLAILSASQGEYYVTLPSQAELDPLNSLVFYQNAYHGYLAYLTAAGEPGGSLSGGADLNMTGVRLTELVQQGIDRIPQLDLPRPPAASVTTSPWHTAEVRLLPGAIEQAAVAAGLRTPGAGTSALLLDPAGPTLALGQQNTMIAQYIDPITSSGLFAPPIPHPTVNARFLTFFHPHAATYVREFTRDGISGLFTLENQQLLDPVSFDTAYHPVPARVAPERPKHDVDFATRGAYSVYNWELFFHIPMLIATRLSQHQRSADADRYFDLVLKLTDDTPLDPADDTPQRRSRRFWKVKPLRDAAPERLEQMLAGLSARTSGSAEDQDLTDQLEILAKYPFQPHRLARLRPIAYQKFVLMKKLDNAIGRADQLFRQDTIESVNESIQWYVLASKALGARPERIPAHRQSEPVTFADLRPRLDVAGNAMVQMEHDLPLAGVIAGDGDRAGLDVLLSMGSNLYFCIPQNDKLLSYWDVVEDRLFKIRNSLNIEGVERQLPLFEPPIDPALLVRAAAAGVEISTVLSGLAVPIPRYRFSFMLAKAVELCNELRTFGAALLAALEKRDGEALALMRAEHESVFVRALTEVKAWQAGEARSAISALQAQREIAVHRLSHFSRMRGADLPDVAKEPVPPGAPDAEPIVGATAVAPPSGRFELTDGGKITIPGAAVGAAIGGALAGPAGGLVGAALGGAAGSIDVASLDSGAKMLSYERQDLVESALASVHAVAGAGADALAGALSLIPQFTIAAEPWGVGSNVSFGGSHLAAVPSAAGRVLGALGSWHSFQASVAQKLAGFVWREQDYAYQCEAAALEIAQIDRQLITAQIRLALAKVEQSNHLAQVAQADEVLTFLQDKYTDQELYGFLERETGSLFWKGYQLAYDAAKQAQRTFCFELGLPDSNIIEYGYWDSFRKGLLSGERLALALRQLERAYLDQNQREYEITRHVSLLQLDPAQLVSLRATGSCEFELPEALFDLDFPGHYFRRIKSVSVSVPCVVGPYTSINGTLTLLNNRLRIKASAQDPYDEQADGNDPRFLRDHVPVQSVATSTAQSDSGLFELNFRDERYLPFESAGAISRWRFQVPDDFRQFDYTSISDVVLTLRYTAREGGSPLRKQAVEGLKRRFGGERTGLVRMFSLRNEFPAEWHQYNQIADTDTRTIKLTVSKDRFPYVAARGKITLTNIGLLVPGGTPKPGNVAAAFLEKPAGNTLASVELSPSTQAGVYSYAHTSPLALEIRERVSEEQYDEWQFIVPAPQPGNPPPTDLLVLCGYRFKLAD
jgi:hypothetical protein